MPRIASMALSIRCSALPAVAMVSSFVMNVERVDAGLVPRTKVALLDRPERPPVACGRGLVHLPLAPGAVWQMMLAG